MKENMSTTKRKPSKLKCEAATFICSGELVRPYAVNKSDKTFNICGPCAVYLRRGGNKLK